MKTKILFLFLLAASVSCQVATGGKNVVKEFDARTSYRLLDVGGSINVVYGCRSGRLKIIADSLAIPAIKVISDSEKLKIYINNFKNTGVITAMVPASTSLEAIRISGASSFTSDSTIVAEKLAVELSGASGFNARVSCDTLEANVSGASAAGIDGFAGHACIQVSGTSKLSSWKDILESDTAVVDISGASKADIICNESISGQVSGSSKLIYGGAAECGVKASGVSRISAKQ